MNVLEEFWYGNIEPTEYDTSSGKEYKELLQLISQNEEKLLATMNGADIHSVFDICWYTFARMIADTAPPVDYGAEDMFAQGSVLSCMACGNYFVRRSSRQRYCQRPECQAERNRKNRRASYARHKDD